VIFQQRRSIDFVLVTKTSQFVRMLDLPKVVDRCSKANCFTVKLQIGELFPYSRNQI